MRFDHQTFTTDVTIDYNQFVDCEFKNCVIFYHGGDFSLIRAKFTNVRFGLAGAANMTLGFLKLIRATNPKIIDELLDQGPQLSPDQKIMFN